MRRRSPRPHERARRRLSPKRHQAPHLSRPRRIALLGHVGNGNLGDEAIIAALLAGIRTIEPRAEIIALTVRPADTAARHGIPAYGLRPGLDTGPASLATAHMPTPPADARLSTNAESSDLRAVLRRVPGLWPVLSGGAALTRRLRGLARESAFWWTRYRRMQGIDLLIVAGSNQLSDYFGGPWNFPYNLWAWTWAARRAGARVAFLSVGAGPIRESLSRFYLRGALRRAAYVSYRDAGSRDAVIAMGASAERHAIAPDLAYGLQLDAPTRSASGAGRLIGIVPLPYFDPRSWAERDEVRYARYVETLAAFAASLLRDGDRVTFVPTQLRSDPPVVADIVRALQARVPVPDPAALAPRIQTFEDLTFHLGRADYVVATRFHGVLIAQMLGKPTLGLIYRPSMRGQLDDVGQGAYALDVATITPESLRERLRALEQDAGAGDRIRANLESNRAALEAQLSALLRTVQD